MLHFFRRIRLRLLGQALSDKVRKSLLGSAQVRKYILYATGEVLLIMVGILLALQVNNWNEGRKEQEQMFSYIKAIHTDMMVEQDRLNKLIARFKEKSEVSASIMEILENPGKPIIDSTKTFNNLIFLGGNVGIDRKTNTWDELKSTGKFQVLEDQNLVQMLTDHYQFYDIYINNFNRLPLDKLDELKEIASSIHNSHSIRQLAIKSELMFSPNTFEKFISHKELYNLISSIGLFTSIYNMFFIEVKDQAYSIIIYLEETYPELIVQNS
jgi:hypothetical protein